jgi:hypothetical protein
MNKHREVFTFNLRRKKLPVPTGYVANTLGKIEVKCNYHLKHFTCAKVSISCGSHKSKLRALLTDYTRPSLLLRIKSCAVLFESEYSNKTALCEEQLRYIEKCGEQNKIRHIVKNKYSTLLPSSIIILRTSVRQLPVPVGGCISSKVQPMTHPTTASEGAPELTLNRIHTSCFSNLQIQRCAWISKLIP